MQYLLNRKIYLSNIFIILASIFIILYLLYTNLEVNKKNIYNENYIRSEYLAQLINSDINIFITGLHESIININSNNSQQNIETIDLVQKHLNNYILNIALTDKKGKVIYWAKKRDEKNLSYKPYIKYHLQNKLFTNDLFLNKEDQRNKKIFIVSKGFYKNKSLEKIIVFYIDLDSLNKRYEKYITEESLTIASIKGDIYIRIPNKKKCCTQAVKEFINFSNKNIDKENTTIYSSIDQENKLVTFIRSRIYPLITSVEIKENKVLNRWQNHRVQIFFIAMLLISLSGFLIFYYTRLQSKIDELTQLDPLTQIYNIGFFEQLANREFIKAKRLEQDLPVLMIDIDDFKNLNDTHGHHVGDKVIKRLADTIKLNIREDIDSCGRYGGKEFVVLLSNTDINGAIVVANRIKDSFKTKKINKNITPTISIGISNIQTDDFDIEDILSRAQEAMYRSKEDEKDKINTSL